jgi:hypothetical protein
MVTMGWLVGYSARRSLAGVAGRRKEKPVGCVMEKEKEGWASDGVGRVEAKWNGPCRREIKRKERKEKKKVERNGPTYGLWAQEGF